MIANTGKLAGRTIFISGASRGIGKSIALKAAKDGANIVVVAKTAEPHPKLPGTIYTAAKEIEAAGGRALPCTVDVRDENQVNNAVEQAVNEFGGIDIVINNASAISLTDTLSTDMKKYDLMNSINARGTFLVSKACLPFLKKSANPHIINLSPPISMNPKWFSNNLAYTLSKYGMSMCAIGMADEFKKDGIAVNAIWPKTAIHTAAIEMLAGSEASNSSRKPEIVADAVYAMLCKDSKTFTGQLLIDEDVLRNEGVTDFTSYACNPDNKDNLMLDFFLDNDETTSQYKSIIPDEGKQGSTPVEDSKNEQLNTIFSTIRLNLSADLVQKIGATYQFNITGEDEGSWFLDLKNGTGALVKGPSSQSPETSLTLEAKNFFELFTGKIKPATAYMMGKVRVEGNLQNAMKLEKLMKNLKAKL